MKKFKFRLEKVLTHKERLFEIARGKHGEALSALRKEEATLDLLRNEYKNTLYALSEEMKTNFKIRDLGHYYRYMTFTKREIARQSQVVFQAMEREEKLRIELMKAAQEKEVLVKLKEKQYQEYLYATKKEEQDILDDLTASKYARSKKD